MFLRAVRSLRPGELATLPFSLCAKSENTSFEPHGNPATSQLYKGVARKRTWGKERKYVSRNFRQTISQNSSDISGDSAHVMCNLVEDHYS